MMWLKSIKALTWVASISLVSAAFFIAYIVLFPVDVITNWKLSIAKSDYTLGDTVVIESMYTKNFETPSDSHAERYLECKNNNDIYVRYLLSEALANRSASKSTGTGILVTIPEKLTELKLPTTCFFSIAITYNVYPRRAQPEYNRTQSFTLHPKGTDTTTTPTTSIQPQNTNEPGEITIPEQTIQTEQPTSSTSPQPTTQPTASTPEPQSPNIFQQLFNLVGLGA